MARQMKDSGIAWIGEIPKEWGTIRFKYLHDGMNTGESIDKEFWSLDKNDALFYTAGIEPIRTNYDGFPKWKFTHESDLLLSRNGTPYVYLPPASACYTDHIIRANLKAGLNRQFIRYNLQQSISSVVVDGVSLSTWSASLWNEQVITWPSADEQHRIADFLDSECANIDAVIEQTRASIEEYKKLKQSVITQAVTKGIRPDRNMVDSGVDWIGKIPDEWAVFRIANLYDERNEKGSEDLPILTVSINSGISDHEIPDDEKSRVFIRSEDKTLYKKVCPGDLAYNMMRAWQGAFGAVRVYGMVSPAYVVVKPKTLGILDSRYIEALLRTSSAIEEMHRFSKGITDFRLRLYWPEFKNICVCVPSLNEQIEIADYIDAKSAEIDSLIQKKNLFLSELETYKKSLIYEYVTGKSTVLQSSDEPTITFVDLRALLMCRIIELMNPKGRIHLQKALFCVDCLTGINQESLYARWTHGPYDSRIEEYENTMEKHGWVYSSKGKAINYSLADSFSQYSELYFHYYRDIDEIVQRICAFLKPMKTSQAERVATLLAAWNDFILDGISPTETQIVTEVRTNWTTNKANSAEATWLGTLKKMIENSIIPTGLGTHTIHKI